MKSEFEYFQPEPTQIQVERTSYTDHTPIAALQHGCAIEFFVPGVPQQYLDLSRSYLYVRAKITDATGGNVGGTVNVGPVNLTMQSLFSNVDVELCSTRVSDSNGLYPYRAMLETLISYNEDAQASHLTSSIWKKDTAGQMNLLVSIGNPALNLGLKERTLMFLASNEVEMIGRPHADLFHQPKCIPQNCSLKLKLTPTRDEFRLITPLPEGEAAQVQYRVVITEARLCIRTLQVSPATVMAHEQVLMTTNMRFPIRRVTMKHLAIPRGQTSILHDNIYLGTLPRRILLAFVDDTAMTGSYQQNPFNFQNFGINHLALYVNGEMVPKRAYEPNFTTGRFVRDYLSIFQGTDTLFSNRSINITRNEFANGYALWMFDLSGDVGASGIFRIPKTGAVRVEVKFANATAATINLLCYAEFDGVLELDRNRSVIAPS